MTNIKNGDLPAMPSDVKVVFEAMTNKQDQWCLAATGMTKREMMAMHLMAALLSDSKLNGSADNFAKYAVISADALLAELELTK